MFINNFLGQNMVRSQQRCCKVNSKEGEVSFKLEGIRHSFLQETGFLMGLKGEVKFFLNRCYFLE